MPDRVSLAEMVEEIDDELFEWQGRIARCNRETPNDPLPPTHHWVRRARALKAAGDVLRIMASYEDRSRTFVGRLIKDYADGKWP